MTIEAQLERIAVALETIATNTTHASRFLEIRNAEAPLNILAVSQSLNPPAPFSAGTGNPSPAVAAVPVAAVVAQPRRGRPPKAEAVAGQAQPDPSATAGQTPPAAGSPAATIVVSAGSPPATGLVADGSTTFLTGDVQPVTKEAVLTALEAAVGRATTRLGNAASAHKEVFKVFQTVSGEESLPALVKNAPEKFAAVIAAAEAVM